MDRFGVPPLTTSRHAPAVEFIGYPANRQALGPHAVNISNRAGLVRVLNERHAVGPDGPAEG